MPIRLSIDMNQQVQRMGNALYFLFIFVVMLDPTNTVLHLKDILFVLLVGFNCVFYKPDWRYLPFFLLPYAVIFLSYVISEMQGSVIDEEAFMRSIKGFSPLFLLLWTPYYNVVRLSKVPVVLVSILIAVLFFLICFFEPVEAFVWYFVKEHNDMIMMTHRDFLGFSVYGMYYKSMISFVFALYLIFYKVYNERSHRVGNFILLLICSLTFLVSGTRATMLFPFFMLGLVMLKTLQRLKRSRYLLYPVLSLFILGFLAIVALLAMDKGEASNAIKYAHLTSYADLFEAHPEYLLWGQGCGAVFYSAGFQAMVSSTEWTYFELLRNYGIFSVGILLVMCYPLVRMARYYKIDVVFGLMGSYIAYLFIAGTNPLLISSTGMIVLLMGFSVAHLIDQRKDELLLSQHDFVSRYL